MNRRRILAGILSAGLLGLCALFLIGHNEYSGKCLANTDAVDLGLAGAVLGELLLSDRIAVVDGRVLVRDPRPYQDRVTDAALAELLRQREAHPPRAWVEYLSEDVRDIVGQRLASINLPSLVLTVGAILAVFRFKAGMISVLAACSILGVLYYLAAGRL